MPAGHEALPVPVRQAEPVAVVLPVGFQVPVAVVAVLVPVQAFFVTVPAIFVAVPLLAVDGFVGAVLPDLASGVEADVIPLLGLFRFLGLFAPGVDVRGVEAGCRRRRPPPRPAPRRPRGPGRPPPR